VITEPERLIIHFKTRASPRFGENFGVERPGVSDSAGMLFRCPKEGYICILFLENFFGSTNAYNLLKTVKL